MKLLCVNFHYIRDTIYNNGIYPRTLQQLSEQVDIIGKSYEFISQEELVKIIKSQYFPEKNYCLLTFDDGFKEHIPAFDLLKSKGIPSIFYISTYPIKNNSVLAVHKLHHIRSELDDNKILNIIGNNISINEDIFPHDLKSLYRYDSIEAKKVKYLLNFHMDVETKNKVIDNIFESIADEKSFSQELYMNKDDIKYLGKFSCIGTHTDKHLPLATLTKENIIKEISKSLDFLRDECALKDIPSISYPYGGDKAVSEEVASISSQYNFNFGLTMSRGINTIKNFSNPLSLKRIDTNDAPGGKLKSKEFIL